MLLHDFFEDSRRRTPEKPALVSKHKAWTYEDVGAYADAVSTVLCELDGEPSRVGLWTQRSPEAVASILGILKAGACYVPLDPDSPVARIATIVNDCDLQVLIVDSSKAADLADLYAAASQIDTILQADPFPVPSFHGTLPPSHVSIAENIGRGVAGRRVTDKDLAYIFFTSGSTGKPKGVMISHLNVVDFISWSLDALTLRPDDHLMNPTPLFFDLSTFDLHATFAAGATLHMISESELLSPKAIIERINGERITVWFSVPSLLSYLCRMKVLKPGMFPSLHTVMWCGEVFPTKDLNEWMNTFPDKRFVNLYGPTETTVASTFHVFERPPKDLTKPITIGKPCDNTKVAILGDNNAILGVGEEGEICIGGNSVMHGYWRRPERTESALVQNPAHADYPDLFYRTGDIGKWEEDGTITLLGRSDSQIKTRGYRIELGDIDAAFASHPAVDSVCTVAYPSPEFGNVRIKVYFAADDPDLDRSVLQAHVSTVLPKYMIPQKIQRLDSLPRLPNGKIDRKACAQLPY